jgi:hypothetical protein
MMKCFIFPPMTATRSSDQGRRVYGYAESKFLSSLLARGFLIRGHSSRTREGLKLDSALPAVIISISSKRK